MKEKNYFVNDSALVKACLENDSKAQEKLYDLYSKSMFGLCKRMMGNKQDAEDVFQNAFISVFTKLDLYQAKSPLKYWIKKIFVNHCINELKKRKENLFLDIYYEEETNENDFEIEYDVNSIQKALTSLPVGYRTILNLYLFEGYNHKEIATILNISESTSKSQYSRAKKKLRQLLIRAKKYEQA